MNECWSCKSSLYHNYKDSHGIRCPRCGAKEKDDPAKQPVVKTEPVKRVTRSK